MIVINIGLYNYWYIVLLEYNITDVYSTGLYY